MTTPDDLRRLTAQSRLRIAAAEDLREQYAVIARQSRRRLDAGRELLDRCSHRVRV